MYKTVKGRISEEIVSCGTDIEIKEKGERARCRIN